MNKDTYILEPYQIMAILIWIAFYTFYFAKIIMQKKQSIKTHQMGKGNKPKKVLAIEWTMSVANLLASVAGVGSIFGVKSPVMPEMGIAGILTGIFAVIIFALATITMKTSWRVGISEERTALVTEGIYKWSRNPAFVGFDLLYAATCLMFFNVPLLVMSVWAAVMLHLQILQEEKYLHKMFGREYDEYRKHTWRYMGRR